jgi:3-deoxy-D-manno-octulosonic-acid transferase
LKIKGIYFFLYRILQAFGLPLLLLYLLLRGMRNAAYRRSLAERFGFIPPSFRQTGPGAIWLHAVSVGEVLSCARFAAGLRAAFPHSPVFLSTATVAGYAAARQKLGGVASGVFYAPVDTVWAVRRVLRALQPSVVVVAETEIWPNLFRETKRTGAALALVNGRISDRAFPRYRRLPWVWRAVLDLPDLVLAQSPAMAERFRALGTPPARMRDGGNFKYDFEPHAAPAGSPVLEWAAGGGPVWIAASTMPPADAGDPDEDDVVIAAHLELRRDHPDLRLILVPRKPERFDRAAKKLEAAGVEHVRRSSLPPATPYDRVADALSAAGPPEVASRPGNGSGPAAALPHVLLLDTIGELSGLFGAADVVFMGGTLAHRGGHNILEPAFFSKPVIVGPHMENFQAIADEFHAAGASVGIADGAALAGAVARLLEAPEEARAISRRAQACAEASRGATARAVAAVRELYHAGVPAYRVAQPWYALAWPLAQFWKWGSRRGQARAVTGRRELPVPVISVGNITMGGTGKTPCVLRLAELLHAAGRRPGILTRGYGRSSPESQLLLAPGTAARAERTGDEPQIFVRAGVAPVGVGADRFATGTGLVHQFGVDVLLLDDGFQHRRLARALDIVLVDALRPFGGGCLFPLGRLREPLQGLRRADMFLITRSEISDLPRAIESALRCYNPKAPVFCARVGPRAWVEHSTGREFPVAERPFERAGVICGLGNPLSFRRTLESLGVVAVDWVEFPDHHRYRPDELRRVAQQAATRGATVLVTTEKDAMNLPDDWEPLLAPLDLYWLKASMAIDREAEFFQQIAAAEPR